MLFLVDTELVGCEQHTDDLSDSITETALIALYKSAYLLTYFTVTRYWLHRQIVRSLQSK